MDKRELLARISLALILVVMPVGFFIYQYALRPAISGVRVIDIRHAVGELINQAASRPKRVTRV